MATADTASADSLGNYRVTLPFNGDPVTLSVIQFIAPGSGYAGHFYGWVAVVPDQDRTTDLVMTHYQPI